MVLLSQGIGDGKVLLDTEAGERICWGRPGTGKSEGMGFGKLI